MSFTFTGLISMLATMLIMAAIPSVSVLTVTSRAASYGFVHGVVTTLGIVAGDIIFILVAVYGLSLLSHTLEQHFVWIKYIGALYLIWLGIRLWRSQKKSNNDGVTVDNNSTLTASFVMGLLITLGDQKAILFYLGFLPAFVDLSGITFVDTGALILIAFVAICIPKFMYAYLSDKASLMLQKNLSMIWVNGIAAMILVSIGVFVIIKG